MATKVIIKQFKNKAKKPVAGLTPEHAVYDANGVRLDAKLGSWNLSNIRDAQTEGVRAVQEAAKQYDHQTVINNGTITNAADEEDITVRDNVLSLKDRTHIEGVDEMGYVILRKNKSFKEQVTKKNTIYEIRYDFDLRGEEITIPEGCVLKFEGGSFRNGNINGGLVLNVPNKPIFYNLGLSNIKFINNTTPESFGAIGDGSTDDTESLRYAIYYSSLLGVKLVCVPKIKYRITNSLNYYNNAYYDVKLNIYGEQHKSTTSDHSENRKTFLIDTDVKLFKDSTIQGIIKNCDFTTVNYGDDNSSMFDNCRLKEFIFDNNHVDRFNSFMNNTSVGNVSYIKNNRIASRYFSKVTARCGGLVDSYIINNYITGEAVNTLNNYCFGWYEYNAATISNNFIDYFKIIYSPQLYSTVQTVLSIGNQYQVFKYFYPCTGMYEDKECTIALHNCGINSIGDSFNWLDPNSLDYLKKLTPYYIKREIENTETYEDELEIIEAKPYIYAPTDNTIIIQNALIEGNIKEHIYIPKTLACDFKRSINKYSFSRLDAYSEQNDILLEPKDNYYPYYNDQRYKGLSNIDGYNVYNEFPVIVKNNIFSYWAYYPLGFKVKINNRIYELRQKTIGNNESKYYWKDITSNGRDIINDIGTCKFVANKPYWWDGLTWRDYNGGELS